MIQPPSRRELRLLHLLFFCSVISLAFHVGLYTWFGRPDLPDHPAPAIAGLTGAGADAAIAEYSQRIAVESLQAITLASLKDRAFRSALWSTILVGLFGYLEWRLWPLLRNRGGKAGP